MAPSTQPRTSTMAASSPASSRAMSRASSSIGGMEPAKPSGPRGGTLAVRAKVVAADRGGGGRRAGYGVLALQPPGRAPVSKPLEKIALTTAGARQAGLPAAVLTT